MRKKSVTCLTLAVIASILLAGCAAELLVSPNDPYGPEGEKVGIVRYRAEGLSADARRQDAKKKMYDACNGHYKILAEGPRDKMSGGVVSNSNGLIGGFRSRDYMYIRFECVTP